MMKRYKMKSAGQVARSYDIRGVFSFYLWVGYSWNCDCTLFIP